VKDYTRHRVDAEKDEPNEELQAAKKSDFGESARLTTTGWAHMSAATLLLAWSWGSCQWISASKILFCGLNSQFWGV